MITIKLKTAIKPEQCELLKGKFLNDSHYDTLISEDCDAYDLSGKLLFRFRKNVIPLDLLKNYLLFRFLKI